MSEQRITTSIHLMIERGSGARADTAETYDVSSWEFSEAGHLTIVLDKSTDGELHQLLFPAGTFGRIVTVVKSEMQEVSDE